MGNKSASGTMGPVASPVPVMQNDPLNSSILDPARLDALDSYRILDTAPEEGFDDVVRLATRLCDAPVALVSLVSHDRQWFKARVGFPHCETDLDRSVCKFVLTEPELLVISDLTQDARTAANPLVTGEPHIRFYAGAPLRMKDGTVLGSLCVIDTVPRPDGLTSEQTDDLHALARQVSSLLELRRTAIGERHAQEAALANASRLESMMGALSESEARYRALFENIDAGFCICEVKFGADGRAVDHRVLAANPAFARHTGLSDVVGRWANEVAPGIEQHWHDAYGEVARTGQPVRFEGEAAPLGRWYDAHLFPAGSGRVAMLIADVTERRRAEAALRASEALARENVQRVQLALAAGAIIGTWHWDLPTDRFTVDEAFARSFGLDPALGHEGIPLAQIVATVHPDDQAGLASAIDKAIANGGAYAHQYRVRRTDGRYYWIEANGHVDHGPDGTPRSFPGVLLDVEERRAAQKALAESEAYWRGLFERLSEGFIVGEVIRDRAGRIVDWRYIDVNAAWGKLVGVDSAGVVGRTIREVFPGIEDEWVGEFAEVVEGGHSTTFTRQVGTLARWYEGRAFPLGSERFGVIFLEITDRVKAEARRNALLSLGDRMRDMDTRSAMTAAAAEIVGSTLGAVRAGFARIGGDMEWADVELDWTQPGVASIAGRHRFDDYGDVQASLRRGEPLVIADVTTDPRAQAERWLAIGAHAIVNMPVRERGRTVAMFIVHDDKPRHWTIEELVFLRNVADRVEVGVGRVRAEEQQAILNGELSHRLKNTLAMVQGIASQTLRTVSDQAPIQAFTERLIALSRAHDVLMQDSWTAAPIRSVVEKVLALQTSTDRFRINGPNLALTPQATLSLSLLLHELTTNAVKYGALSTDAGVVQLSWRIETGAEPLVVLRWQESGGPPAVSPTRRGFGARLIQSGLVGTRDTHLSYEAAGLDAEFRAPISQIVAS